MWDGGVCAGKYLRTGVMVAECVAEIDIYALHTPCIPVCQHPQHTQPLPMPRPCTHPAHSQSTLSNTLLQYMCMHVCVVRLSECECAYVCVGGEFEFKFGGGWSWSVLVLRGVV